MKPKIFVTVGSGWFDELISTADKLPFDVRMQIGSGKFIPRNHQWFRFAKDLKPHYLWADLVVSHGGAGTLFEVLRLGKKVVAVPNPHYTDNHQVQILEELSRRGHVVYCRSFAELHLAIARAMRAHNVPYVPVRNGIPNVINRWIAQHC